MSVICVDEWNPHLHTFNVSKNGCPLKNGLYPLKYRDSSEFYLKINKITTHTRILCMGNLDSRYDRYCNDICSY